jgi:hypothetical protein
MGSKCANGVTFVVFSHNSAIYADDVARVITSRTMTASGASRPLRRIGAIVSFLNPQMVYRGGRGTHR